MTEHPRRKDLMGFGTSFQSRRWFSLNPGGLVGVSLSWSVHFFALYAVHAKLLTNSPVSQLLFYILYIPVAFLAMASLFKAWTSNPGAVPLGARPLTVVRRASSTTSDTNSNTRAVRRCHKCQDNYKPPRAHHDSVTGRCIVKFDHFCPWVGNAVGALNHKFFCLFLFYTAFTCLNSIFLLLIRVVHCGFIIMEEEDHNDRLLKRYKYEDDCQDFYSSHVVLGLTLASLIFLIFTCSMGCEQLEAIETGKGKIARMKTSVGSTGTEYSAVTQEFNEMFGGNSPHLDWHWFNPFQGVKFPRTMKKVVLGYDWDENHTEIYQESDDRSVEMMERANSVSSASEADGLIRSDSAPNSLNGMNRRRSGLDDDTPIRTDNGNPIV